MNRIFLPMLAAFLVCFCVSGCIMEVTSNVEVAEKSHTAIQTSGLLAQAPILHDFTNKRSSSLQQNGGNHDWIVIPPGQNLYPAR